jgi:hypothetical protein
MISNSQRVLHALREAIGPLCDDCISEKSGVKPRQQVFQLGQKLAAEGLILRLDAGVCGRCRRTKKINLLRNDTSDARVQRDAPQSGSTSDPAITIEANTVQKVRQDGTAALARVEVVLEDGGDRPWSWEGNVQDALRTALKREGWEITAYSNTAAKQAGVDLAAIRDGVRLLIEVKGYPTNTYDHGPNRGQPKPTQPSNQARQWFSHALLSAMKLQTIDPAAEVALCFPDFPTYRNLLQTTRRSLGRLGLGVYLVKQGGEVEAFSEALVADW